MTMKYEEARDILKNRLPHIGDEAIETVLVECDRLAKELVTERQRVVDLKTILREACIKCAPRWTPDESTEPHAFEYWEFWNSVRSTLVEMGETFGCAGWRIKDVGSEEAYLDCVKTDGSFWCYVHNCNAWECFSDQPDPALDSTKV